VQIRSPIESAARRLLFCGCCLVAEVEIAGAKDARLFDCVGFCVDHTFKWASMAVESPLK